MKASSIWPVLALLCACLPAAVPADGLIKRVNRIFQRWDRRDSPGCGLAVVRNGRIVFARGYGMADLEHGIRNSPSTVFHVASVSKQFTAFAVLLLEKDGKLSLDDDPRKYLPELHDFGKRITIRHLLQHTSGLRDQWGLLMLGGWRIDDVITQDDVLRMLWRQRELNYEPGTEFVYCNTGFTLAAQIVERVSGRPFAAFAHERIFAPLGMTNTRFRADYRDIVKDSAHSYTIASKGGYDNSVLSLGTVGATGLITTVEDLARWDRNFYETRVGDSAVLTHLQQTGKLNDGRPIGYALGLDIGTYRGLKIVEHGGADAGFRSTILRFPGERLSIILLANAADVDAGGLARRVADIFLEGRLENGPTATSARPPGAAKAVKVEAALLDSYTGEFRVAPGLSVTIRKEAEGLTVEATGYPKGSLYPVSDTEFRVCDSDAGITFGKPIDGRTQDVVVHFAGQDLPASRLARPVLSGAQTLQFVGDYYSAELGVIYTMLVHDNRLLVRYPRGLEELKPLSDDQFEAPYPISKIRFVRDPAGQVGGFLIDAGAVRGLRFHRVNVAPAR